MANTFYFIRHGFSCANLHQAKGQIISQKTIQDPHLSNWGILASILAGLELGNRFRLDQIFVSPLIRTWETGACMFADRYQKFLIGPYLREHGKGVLGQILTTSNNRPVNYRENVLKFENFKRFVNLNLPRGELRKNETTINYLLEDMANGNSMSREWRKIYNTLRAIQKVQINRSEEYDGRYYGHGDLVKFIDWANRRYTGKNIAVICHSSLIENLVVKNCKLTEYNLIKKNNNYMIRIQTDNSGGIKKCEIIYEGIEKPTGVDLKRIAIECSLCDERGAFLSEKKCQGIRQAYNKKTHYELVQRKTKY